MKMFGIFLLLLLTSVGSGAATFTVTTPGQQTLTNKFLPYAGSGTQLIGNSPAWRDSAGVLGINNYLEGLETLTPAAAVNLDFSTWRTKRITLNQNTLFTAINIPSASTNVQTMLLEVIGDGAFTVSFANVTFQTPTVATPDAGVVTLYALRGDSGAVKGYTQAITATGIGPLTVGYVPLANATNNLTDSIILQNGTTNISVAGVIQTLNGDAATPAYSFTNSPNSGYYHSSNIHHWADTGTEIMRLNFNASPFNGAGRLDLGTGGISFGTNITTAFCYILGGQGSPEGVVAAGPGSLYLDFLNGDIYKKSSGVLDTGWVVLAAGSGTTINPTDGYLPLRSNATTFADSLLLEPDANTIELRNTANNNANFNLVSSNTNNTSNFYRISATDSDGESDLIWLNGTKDLGWGAGTPTLRNGAFSVNVLSTNTMQLRFEINGFSGNTIFYDRGGVQNGLIANASGYTGAGTLFLSDDGTYKAAGGGAALWSSSSGNLTPSPAVDVVSIQSQSADNATNVAAVIDTALPWTLGGTLLKVKTGNGNPVFAMAMNYLTNFWNDWGSMVSLGYSPTPMDFATLTVNTNTHIYNIGDTAGSGQNLKLSSEIYNYGDIVGINQVALNSSELFNYGLAAGAESKYTNSSNHFLFGASTGLQSTNTAVDNLYAFGTQAASYQSLSNVQDAYFFGSHAGEGMIASSINHVFALGSDSVVTNSNDYVFGNALYNYFFPGASIDFAGGSASSKFHVDSSGNVTANSYTAGATNLVGGLAGKVTGAGTSVVGQVPYYTDTSGKAVSPSGSLVLDGTTNASVVGILSPHAVFVTNTITASVGSATAPSITFTNESDTGFYLQGANSIGITAGGGELVRVLSGTSASMYVKTAIGLGVAASSPDVYLVRETANVLRLGLKSASPADQTIEGPDGNGTDKTGGALIFQPGAGTGTGRGGDLIGKTALTGTASGSTANAQSVRFQHVSKAVDLTESTATAFQKFTLATNNYAGGSITATVRASDAAFAMQSLTSTLKFDAVNVGGTNVVTVTQVDNTLAQIPTGGTLTCTYDAINEGSNVFSIRANAASSLTQTTLRVKWAITALNSSDAITVTPQP